ncbi:hypothetical protein SLA2020_245760 [Shorea laevis]
MRPPEQQETKRVQSGDVAGSSTVEGAIASDGRIVVSIIFENGIVWAQSSSGAWFAADIPGIRRCLYVPLLED